jgi:uncharacterized protein YkwD
MHKNIIPILLIASFLTSCISISVDAQETARANFVTATLGPTKSGFVPITLTPVAQTTQPPAVATSANCKDSAVLLQDVTIPDNTQMKPGEKFTKTWEFQNNGKCPWINYTLVFAAGDQMGAPISAPIPPTLPGEKVNVSVDLSAPSSDGIYSGYFTLNDASGKNLPIGIEKTFWVKIRVGNVVPQAITQGNISTPHIPSGGNSYCAYTQNDGYVQQLITLINQARGDAGLPALSVNTQLTTSAQGHSADMACNNFLSHTGSDGSWIGDRIIKSGYAPSSFMEIIAIGSPQDAMRQWRADQPHWDVVLNAGLTEFGVGYAYYASSDFGGYFTVDLGTR